MKFTKEEISRCKQIAGKHRRKIEYGDWYYSEYLKEVLLGSPFINIVRDREIINRDKNIIPLWTISNCLEFLEKRGLLGDWSIDKEWDEDANQTGNICFWWKPIPKGKDRYTLGKTVLEACLKAVLAVLKEAKRC